MDIFEKCGQFTDARLAKAAGMYPYFMPLEDTEGTEVVVDGKRVLMIGSNNYPRLSTEPPGPEEPPPRPRGISKVPVRKGEPVQLVPFRSKASMEARRTRGSVVKPR